MQLLSPRPHARRLNPSEDGAVIVDMKVLVALGVLLLAAAPVASPFQGLSGKWWCTTAKSSMVADTFTIGADGVVHERQEFANNSSGGTWNQTFSYDRASGTWHVLDVGPKGAFTATVDNASNKLIEMVGTQATPHGPIATRERLIFATPHNFVRLWENRPKSHWHFLSYSDCTLVEH